MHAQGLVLGWNLWIAWCTRPSGVYCWPLSERCTSTALGSLWSAGGVTQRNAYTVVESSP
jgi:hypothetical protein